MLLHYTAYAMLLMWDISQYICGMWLIHSCYLMVVEVALNIRIID